jgi:hypothetical protein
VNPEEISKKPEQIQQEKIEQAPKEPETIEELSGQIKGQKKQLEDDLKHVLEKGQSLEDEQDQNIDPELLTQTKSELESLDNEAQTAVHVAMFQLDKLDSPEPEQTVVQENLTNEPVAKPATSAENISDNMKELLLKLPEIFKEFDRKLAALAEKDGFSEKKLEEKSRDIKSSLVESVVNGHLEASDVLNMVSHVEIFSTHSDNAVEQEQIDKLLAQSGYDSTMFVDTEAGKIFIVDKALKDEGEFIDPKTKKPIEIDFKHTTIHELSHILDKRAGVLRNKTLLDACDQLAQIEGFSGTQSMHIRNTLETEGLNQNQIRAEVVADYTALYLKSDGSFDDFVSECLEMTDEDAMYAHLGINEGENVEDNPKFARVIEIYKTFYDEISSNVKENKGKIQPPEKNENEEMEEYGNYFAEPAPATAEVPQNSKHEEGVVSLFLKVAKAIGDETGGQAIPQAGPGL